MIDQSKWLCVKDNPPPPGFIVKFWLKNGSVWAGYYNGSDKERTFDFWLPLPK